jgi:hypothetical protein
MNRTCNLAVLLLVFTAASCMDRPRGTGEKDQARKTGGKSRSAVVALTTRNFEERTAGGVALVEFWTPL